MCILKIVETFEEYIKAVLWENNKVECGIFEKIKKVKGDTVDFT